LGVDRGREGGAGAGDVGGLGGKGGGGAQATGQYGDDRLHGEFPLEVGRFDREKTKGRGRQSGYSCNNSPRRPDAMVSTPPARRRSARRRRHPRSAASGA